VTKNEFCFAFLNKVFDTRLWASYN